MSEDGIRKCFAILKTTFGSRDFNQSLVRVWQVAFHDLPDSAVQHACVAWLKGGKPFFPKPSELRRMLSHALTPLIPEEAWAEVRTAMKRYGPDPSRPAIYLDSEDHVCRYPPLSWSSPLIERAVHAVGWTELFEMSAEKARSSFIWTLKPIVEAEHDRLAYGHGESALSDGGEQCVLSLPEPSEAVTRARGITAPSRTLASLVRLADTRTGFRQLSGAD